MAAVRNRYPTVDGPATFDEIFQARQSVFKTETPAPVPVVVMIGDARVRIDLVVMGCHEQVSMRKFNGHVYWSGFLPQDFAVRRSFTSAEEVACCFEVIDYRPSDRTGTVVTPARYADLHDALRNGVPGISRI